jgi:hypothetical protein
MRRLGVVEQNRILDFGGVAHHAIVADDDILANVGVVANLAIRPMMAGPLIITPSSSTVPSPMDTCSPI